MFVDGVMLCMKYVYSVCMLLLVRWVSDGYGIVGYSWLLFVCMLCCSVLLNWCSV